MKMNAGDIARTLDLVLQLKRRYPGVEILDAYIAPTAAGDRRQHVRFSASAEVLKAHGLLTDAMIERAQPCDARLREPPSPCGDGFFLCRGFDNRSSGWDLSVWTWVDGPDPQERVDTLALQRAARKIIDELARP